jgi:hypothetical protein
MPIEEFLFCVPWTANSSAWQSVAMPFSMQIHTPASP